MGLFDRFRKRPAVDLTAINNGDFYGAWTLSTEAYERILGLSASEMWRTQPYLRTVVTFLARNIAQLGLHTFQRVGETDRKRIRDGDLVTALTRPNRTTTAYELVYGLVADLALHDVAYWLLTPGAPDQRIARLPVGWVTPKGGDALGPAYFEVRANDKGEVVRVDAANMLMFHGWHPAATYTGSSPIHALREILAEQVQAAKYREKVWQRGGKVGAVLTRPSGAPEWSDAARTQFKTDWESKFTGTGPQVGGTPLLEDGMTLNKVDFSAHEMEFVEGARLALNTVASVYHINPTMIGLLDNANYSNVREFRKMLYGDTLGPVIAQIEDRINTFLVPLLDRRPGVYVEFNIEEKLQGNFEEQSAALQSSVGRPWMTANEARALRNMPALTGGDELVTPLNVLVGNQASPTDSGSQNREPKSKAAAAPAVKAKPTDEQRQKVAQVLDAFFDRQGKSVLSAIGAGGDWWDEKRWNRELADDLARVSHTVAAIVGQNAAEALGYDADAYDPDMTVHFLQAVAADRAAGINDTTRQQLAAELALEDDGDPSTVYETAKNARTPVAAHSLALFAASFGTAEAARQISKARGVKTTKTWVTGPNPRATHAAMDGETVPVEEKFSNGMDHPGQGGEEDAGCNCHIEISQEAP